MCRTALLGVVRVPHPAPSMSVALSLARSAPCGLTAAVCWCVSHVLSAATQSPSARPRVLVALLFLCEILGAYGCEIPLHAYENVSILWCCVAIQFMLYNPLLKPEMNCTMRRLTTLLQRRNITIDDNEGHIRSSRQRRPGQGDKVSTPFPLLDRRFN